MISDGGSVQEECYYLGQPCLIMRNRTERTHGLGDNAVLGRFDSDVIREFVKNYKKYECQEISPEASPSSLLIDDMISLELL